MLISFAILYYHGLGAITSRISLFSFSFVGMAYFYSIVYMWGAGHTHGDQVATIWDLGNHTQAAGLGG